jgi:hypothetical protein
MPENRHEVLRGILRGERPLADCALAGIRVTFDAEGLRFSSDPQTRPYEMSLLDAALGLLAYEDRLVELSEWAKFVLGSAGAVDFDDEFETTTEGDAVLSGIWDAAFGSRPSADSLEAARRVTQLN